MRTIPAHLVQKYKDEGWWTDETIGDLLATGLAAAPDVEFRIHSAVRPWTGTFADVELVARRLAAGLRDRGVEPGDVVAFQLPNWMEAAATFWATSTARGHGGADRALLRPQRGRVHPRRGHPEGVHHRGELRPLAVRPRAQFARPHRRRGRTGLRRPPRRRADGRNRRRRPVAAGPHRVHLGYHQLSQGRHPQSPDRSATRPASSPGWYPPDRGRQLTAAPVGHFIGMVNAFLIPVLDGSPINLTDAWDPAQALSLMQSDGLTVGGGATYFVISLLDHPDFTRDHLHFMNYAGLGGSSVPAVVTTRLAELGITVFRSYGSTEHPSIVGSMYDAPEEKRLFTDGVVLSGVEIRLADDGEIFSRGPDLCLGYTDAELTAKHFDDEGWYRTGDVGELDEDGYLTITDRKSDIIIRGGENISALEVEEVLLGMPDVAEAVVVAAPDARLGERAAAVLRLLPGQPMPSDRRPACALRPGRDRQAEVAGGASPGRRLPAHRQRQSPEVSSFVETLRQPEKENSVLTKGKGGSHARCIAVSAVRRGQPPLRDRGGADEVPSGQVQGRDQVRPGRGSYEDRHPQPDQRLHPQPDLRCGRTPGCHGGLLQERQPRGQEQARDLRQADQVDPAAFREPGPAPGADGSSCRSTGP